MNLRFSFHVTGKFVVCLGLLMLVPALCSALYGGEDLSAFLVSAAVTSLAGAAVALGFRVPGAPADMRRRDGFLIAALCWAAASVFGALPYFLHGVFESPVDALFESTAGFTTTGATALSAIEGLPKGMLFWRNFTQWLGGMGMIVLGVAILPRLFVGGVQLVGLEAPGPTTEKFAPKIAETAKKLWVMYMALTVVLCVLLLFGGMSFFDALTHSFSTIATGGFSCRDASVGAYDSVYVQGVITLFMFLGGTSFVLHYHLFSGRPRMFLRSSEFRFYLFFTLAATMFIALELRQTHVYETFSEALRYGSFQVVSIITTTGFTTTDFDAWPPFVKWILFLLMFFGACAGSTSGSMKAVRIMVLFKKGHRELRRLVYPNLVSPIKIDGKAISEKAVSGVTSFFILYVFIFAFLTLAVLMLEDLSLESAVSAAAAAITNVGPGFDEVGPASSYASLGSATKVVLSAAMIVGRLELYTVLVLFTPSFWKT